jgi:hypothetical protein
VLDLVLHVKKLRAALKEVRVERDKLRAVAKAARAWADQEAPEPLEFGDAVIDALVGLKVPGCETSGPKD